MADETTGKLPDLRLAPGEAILGEVAGLSIQVYDQLRSKEWGGLSALHLTTGSGPSPAPTAPIPLTQVLLRSYSDPIRL